MPNRPGTSPNQVAATPYLGNPAMQINVAATSVSNLPFDPTIGGAYVVSYFSVSTQIGPFYNPLHFQRAADRIIDPDTKCCEACVCMTIPETKLLKTLHPGLSAIEQTHRRMLFTRKHLRTTRVEPDVSL